MSSWFKPKAGPGPQLSPAYENTRGYWEALLGRAPRYEGSQFIQGERGDLGEAEARGRMYAGEALGRARNYTGSPLNLSQGLPDLMSIMDVPTEEGLWNTMARRFRESMLPTMSARGLATSGPGMKLEREGIGELADLFGTRAFERGMSRAQQVAAQRGQLFGENVAGENARMAREQFFQQAMQGVQALETLPIQMRQQLIATLLGVPIATPDLGPSIFTQIAPVLTEGAKAAPALKCYVAEELYGKHDPRTWLARAWATTHDTAFTRAYGLHGKEWAAYVREHPEIKETIRPIWDAMWKSALNENLAPIMESN